MDDKQIELYTGDSLIRITAEQLIKHMSTRGTGENNVEDLRKLRRLIDSEIAKLEGMPDPNQLTMEGI